MADFRPARKDDFSAIRALLAAQGLPNEDIDGSNDTGHFHVAEENGQIVGCAGLELYGHEALLRSVAVMPEKRGGGLGRTLVGIAERDATAIGVQRLFLLTTDAAEYFQALGFHIADRSTAPAAIQDSSQFSMLCPATAICLSKELAS